MLATYKPRMCWTFIFLCCNSWQHCACALIKPVLWFGTKTTWSWFGKRSCFGLKYTVLSPQTQLENVSKYPAVSCLQTHSAHFQTWHQHLHIMCAWYNMYCRYDDMVQMTRINVKVIVVCWAFIPPTEQMKVDVISAALPASFHPYTDTCAQQ